MAEEPTQPAYLRLRDREVGRRDRADHRDHEEQEIGDDDPPQSAGRRIERGHRAGHEDDLVLVQAE